MGRLTEDREQMELSNREIATLIWLIVFAVGVFSYTNMWQSFYHALKAFCAPQILTPLAAAFTYIAASLFFLSAVGIWEWASLKTSVIWALTFALVAVFDVNRITEDSMYFRKTLRDIFSATAIVVFVMELHSFSLLAELVLLPLMSAVGLAYAMSKTQPEWKSVRNLLEFILTIICLWIFIYKIYQITLDFRKLNTEDTAKEFFIPILLSLMFLPFIYCLSVYETYEKTFRRIRSRIDDPSLQNYARWQAILHFRTDLDFLRRWARHVALSYISDRENIKQSIRHIKAVKKREKNPPTVAEKDGWSPHIAKNFLLEAGLSTNDYYFSYDGWYASSPYKEIGDAIMQDNIAYYLEGNETAVMCLKLKLNVNNPDTPTDSLKQFFDLAKLLLSKALGEQQAKKITWKMGTHTTQEGNHVSLIRQDWNGSIKGGYDLILSVAKV
jgi:hypothetical protein